MEGAWHEVEGINKSDPSYDAVNRKSPCTISMETTRTPPPPSEDTINACPSLLSLSSFFFFFSVRAHLHPHRRTMGQHALPTLALHSDGADER